MQALASLFCGFDPTLGFPGEGPDGPECMNTLEPSVACVTEPGAIVGFHAILLHVSPSQYFLFFHKLVLMDSLSGTTILAY